MTFWDFIASIIDSLAWPALILGVVLLFRKTIADLLAGAIAEKIAELTEFATGRLKASFQKTAEKAKTKEEASGEHAKSPKQLGLPEDIADMIAKTPNLAVAVIWGHLEKELEEAVERAHGWSVRNCVVNIRYLQSAGDIDPDDGQSLSLMRFTQRSAASMPLSSKAVVDVPQYLKVAEYLIDKLQQIGREQDN